MSSNTIIKDATIFTCNKENDILLETSIILNEDKIIAFESDLENYDIEENDEVIDAKDMVVIPGIINSHTHVAGAIFRGLIDEGQKGLGLYNVGFPMEKLLTEEELYWLFLIGLTEVIKNGVTLVNDFYYKMDMFAQIANHVGIRAIVSATIYDTDMTKLISGSYERNNSAGEKRLKYSIDIIEKWKDKSDLIDFRIGPHATDTCSKSLLKKAKEAAESLDIGLHMHCAQSELEVDYIKKQYNMTPIRLLESLGILKKEVILAHCHYMDKKDWDLIKKYNASYAHCPIVYTKGGNEYPKLNYALEKNIKTGFGTDWIRMTPWEGMRTAIGIMRTLHRDSNMLMSREVLSLNTRKAAEALNMNDKIGSIELGKKADLVIVDMDKVHLQPFYGNPSGLVYNVNGNDVSTVIINGKVIMKNRKMLTIDEQKVLRKIKSFIPVWINRAKNFGVKFPNYKIDRK